MSEYSPYFAPLAVIGILGMGFVLVLCLSVAIFGLLWKSRRISPSADRKE